MNAPASCPACGLALPEKRLEGLCPACAWKGLSEPDESNDAVTAGNDAAVFRVPGHEILGELARGGMGIVYRVRQIEPERLVALKMLLPRQLASEHMAERFRLEVRALTELDHPAILPVYQVGEHQGLPFFTMKLATGGTLAERRQRYLGQWRAIAQLMRQLAEAVQFAHDRGVLHRDLKPGNILFDDGEQAYVSDFGLAKLADTEADLTRSVDFLGTPLYVAPEVATRSARYATTASDIYSLGAIFYELLSGHPPFEAEGLPALLRKIAEDDPAPPSAGLRMGKTEPAAEAHAGWAGLAPQRTNKETLSTLPHDLEVICLKCLAKEPSRRYASAGQLAKDLRCWLNGEPISARPVTRSERFWKWACRNPVLASLALTLLVSLSGGGIALWRSDRETHKALAAARQAENHAQSSLAEALLAQAQALGAAHNMGQRWQALQALAQAARIRPSLALRNEAAAALARPDLMEVQRFPAVIGPAGSAVVFTSDLGHYVVPEASGGFSLRSTANQEVVARFPGQTGKPARWFVLGPHDSLIAALLDDYSLEGWRWNGSRPEFRWQGTLQRPPVIEFRPDGKTLAGYAPAKGLFLQQLDGAQNLVLELTNGRVLFMRFNPRGTRLAVVLEPERLEMWDTAGPPHRIWTEPMHKPVPWLAWSPDGRQLLAAADDGRGIRVFTAENGQLERSYSRHLLYPRQFEFDPSGRTVASVGDDWTLRLWDAGSGQDLVAGIGRHRVLRFSSDGLRLTTAPSDTELAVMELAPHDVFREFTGSAPASEVTASGLAQNSDGTLLLVTQPQLHLYDTIAGAELNVLEPPGAFSGCGAFFDADNTGIFYSCRNRGIYRRSLRAMKSESGSVSCSLGPETLVANHPDGLIRLNAEEGQTWVCQTQSGLELWRHRDPAQTQWLGASSSLNGLAVSQNARWAATVEPAAERVVIWDCATARVLTNLTASAPNRVWFSPDSGWLVASLRGGYRAWSTATWKAGAAWPARLDSGDPGELAFTDDSRLVAARLERATFQLLSFPEGHELVTLKPPLVLPIRSACLRHDGQRLWLLSSSFRILEWDLAELRSELAKLRLDWE